MKTAFIMLVIFGFIFSNAAYSEKTVSKTQKVAQVKIIDPSGFEKPLVAATIMIPEGWQAQGGVVWQQNNSGCGVTTPHVNWVASSPDGTGAITLLPGETWSGNNMQFQMQGNPCPNVMVTDAKQVILNYVQRYRPNAQLIEYYDRQDAIRELVAQLQPPSNLYGVETSQWAGAGQALIAYQVNGKPMREIIGTSVVFTGTRSPDLLTGGTTDLLSISINPGYAMRMPEGQLDLQQAERIRTSMKAGQEWSARMAQHNAKIADINAKGAADRARITRQTNQEIFEMQQDSWRKQNEASDRGNREFSEYIRDVETYNDPSGGTVELDSTHEHAWQLDDGTYVTTDDPSFNPYETYGQGGQELEVTR